MAAEFEVHIREHGITHVYGCVGPTGLVDVVNTMIAHLPDAECREVARRKLMRRLAHPEVVGLSEGPPTLETDATIHPKPGSRLAAHEGGPWCVCGASRRNHDIDGLRGDCDGYTEAP